MAPRWRSAGISHSRQKVRKNLKNTWRKNHERECHEVTRRKNETHAYPRSTRHNELQPVSYLLADETEQISRTNKVWSALYSLGSKGHPRIHTISQATCLITGCKFCVQHSRYCPFAWSGATNDLLTSSPSFWAERRSITGFSDQ